MLLTDAERKLFESYCRNEIKTCNELADQIDRMMANGGGKQMAAKYRAIAKAHAIVAMELRGGGIADHWQQ